MASCVRFERDEALERFISLLRPRRDQPLRQHHARQNKIVLDWAVCSLDLQPFTFRSVLLLSCRVTLTRGDYIQSKYVLQSKAKVSPFTLINVTGYIADFNGLTSLSIVASNGTAFFRVMISRTC